MYSEASFKNALKNEQTKKKSDKKAQKSDDDEDKEDLTDEEKDALDYQLQRAMDMVIAMDKLQSRQPVVPATDDAKTQE